MKDEPGYFVPVPEWIVLAELTPQALALYTVLLAHVNRERGDGLAWPSMETLAELLGFKHRRSIAIYTRELVALGAVTVTRRDRSTDRRNVYQVSTVPPAGYGGLRSITDFHSARKAERAARSSMGTPVPHAMDTSVSDPWDTAGDKNHTKPTRRTDPYESTSGDEVASIGRRTSSTTESEDQSKRPEICILPVRDFDDRPRGDIPRLLVKAAVGATRRVGIELTEEAKTDIGRALKERVGQGRPRRHLAADLEVWLNDAADGKNIWGWMFGYKRAS